MIEQVGTYYENNGFRRISVSIQGLFVQYAVRNEEVFVLAHYELTEGIEFTAEQVAAISRQFCTFFVEKKYSSIQILHIFYSNHPELLHGFCPEGQFYWMIDLSDKRLLLFEDQPEDFLGIRTELENMILDIQEEPVNKTSEGSLGNEIDADGHIKGDVQRNTTSNAGLFGDEVQSNRPAICNIIIVVINILVFLATDLFLPEDAGYQLMWKGSLYWPAVFEQHEYYRMISSMFLHSGLSHLANNMIVLFFIGDKLERMLGRVKYLTLYFVSGILAGTVSIVYNMYKDTSVMSVGASGAIFGTIGAMAYIIIVNKGHLKEISFKRMLLFLALSLYGGFTNQGIDNAAHVGGLIAGVIIAALLYRRQKNANTVGKERPDED